MSKKYTAEDIQVLSDREHVRKRTAIYLGSTEETEYTVPIFKSNDIIIKEKKFIPALYKSFNEILDNAIDELTQIKKANKIISIHHNCIDERFKICDNGRGVPIDKHPQTGKYTPETVFTELRSGRNFKDDEKDSGVIGTNGVGSSCVAMLSEEFIVRIKRDKKFYEQKYKNGTEIIDEPSINAINSRETGTCIEYKIDKSLKQFAYTNIDEELIENRAFEVALNNSEIKINYSLKCIEEGEEIQREKTFQFKNGFLNYIKEISNNFYEFKLSEEDFDAKYYVILDKYKGIDEKIFIYVNSSLLFEGGTASNFFFNSFCNNVIDGLKKELRKRKLDLNKNDIKQNLLVLATIKMKNPRYDNQSKTRLINQEIKKYIEKMVSNNISKFLSSNKEWVEEILDRAEFRKKIADIADVKKKQRQKKGKLAKLVDCYTKNRSEAIITFAEGDCLDKNTKVLTDKGFKEIEDVILGDKVLTHTFEYKEVIAYKKLNKKEYIINTKYGDISCSENHKFPVYNIQTNEIELLQTKNINPNIHKLLRKK